MLKNTPERSPAEVLGGFFLLALRDVAKARGIRHLAQETQLSRESLYRTLSRKGNPRFSTLEALLESLGLKLPVEVKMDAKASAGRAGAAV